MEIKEILKKRRIELQMTMLELSKKVGVSEATISRWESGDIANMKRDKIVSLAKALQISPAVIMGWDETPKQSTPPISLKEQRLLKSFNKLNDLGQDKVIEYSEDLLSNYRYTVETIAAHNDFADDPEQQRLMKEDLDDF